MSHVADALIQAYYLQLYKQVQGWLGHLGLQLGIGMAAQVAFAQSLAESQMKMLCS